MRVRVGLYRFYRLYAPGVSRLVYVVERKRFRGRTWYRYLYADGPGSGWCRAFELEALSPEEHEWLEETFDPDWVQPW